ncbi:hypothetical protein [uncultured Olleya sp.]|uniref:hypothetical protein n=1 Tax=uncultured Olleya sp. TaxID=757243 RepID=UPI002596EE7F|nr:hypothetical protein [uncultured Olleya sp.]
MKNLKNVGTTLNKTEQKSVIGGFGFIHADCLPGNSGGPCYKKYRDVSGNLVLEVGVCNSNQQCEF